MIIDETINGMVFVEQRTYYIYSSEEARQKGQHSAVGSSEEYFNKQKEYATAHSGKIMTPIGPMDINK